MNEQVKEAHSLVEEAQRLAGVHALLHRFIDTAAEAWIIVDKDGSIVLFNRRASFLFGYLPDEVLHHPIEILLPDRFKDKHSGSHRRSFMAEPYTRPMGANLDLMARHKDGSEFPVLIDLHPETGSDGVYVRAAIRRRTDNGSDRKPT